MRGHSALVFQLLNTAKCGRQLQAPETPAATRLAFTVLYIRQSFMLSLTWDNGRVYWSCSLTHNDQKKSSYRICKLFIQQKHLT